MAISACGEGCHKQMELMLTDIVEAVLPFLQDQVDVTLKFTSCTVEDNKKVFDVC